MSAVALPSGDEAGLLRQSLPALAIGGAGLAIGLWLPMLHLAANRLVVGTPVDALAALDVQAWAVLGLTTLGGLVLGVGRSRIAACGALAILSVALLMFAVGLGDAATDLMAGQPPAARARLASGAWAGLVLLAGAVAAAAGGARVRGLGWFALGGLILAFGLLSHWGIFDDLSLAVEYRARAGTVQAALIRHVALSAAAVALATVACVALHAWRPARGAVEMVINGLQVVPAVALLGALVALTSGLLAAFPSLRGAGLSALGPGPAILAVTAYLLLPLWRGLEAALRSPDPATLDAATAIGLTSRQILTGVRLPLGAPILVGALRVACVQSIGLATLGALVGAGGLGGIVFDGMAQFAPDLILLGALPVIALSLIAERGLSLVEDRARRRWRG